MKPIRVVIVDDSAFVRKVVREMLERAGDVNVVGMARNGKDALEMVADLEPDLVTCDLNMPDFGGVEFVKAQMERKNVPIIILTASPPDAGKVLEALEAGAVDFLQKPTAFANSELLGMENELLEKVRVVGRAPRTKPQRAMAAVAATIKKLPAGKVDIVVLGISTGGPQALRHLIPQLPATFPIPVVMVLHMPVGYTALYAEKLAEISKLRVLEAHDGCQVKKGEALLAPAGRHLTFRREPNGSVTAQLSVQPMDKPHRPSVDILFKAAAETYNDRVLGVVMTGMGNDGMEGAAWIKGKGGTIITEAEESCVIYGMPRAVVEAGLSDGSFPLKRMAEAIFSKLL